MDSFYFDDSEMQDALETLVDKGITPEIYAKVWDMYQQAKLLNLKEEIAGE